MRAFLRRASKKLSRKNLYEFLERQLDQLPNNSLILNVGSGGEIEKTIGRIAIRKEFRITSSDISPDRSPDCVDDISRSSFSNETFDAIIVMEVLEHVPDPHGAANELERLLRPGGRLILSTPFIFPIHDRPNDFYRFTKYGLAHLFRHFDGLTIVERNSWAETLLVLMSRMALEPGRKSSLASILLVPLALLLVPLAALATRLAPTDFMTTGYTLTATKSQIVKHPN